MSTSRLMGSSETLQWVFFDVGSVLMDEVPGLLSFRRWACEQLQRDVPSATWNEFYAELLAGGMGRVLTRYYPDLSPGERGALAMKRWLEGSQLRYFPDSAPTAGIREVLDALAPRFQLGTIANQYDGIHRWMADNDLARYFPVALYSCDLGYGKPDPRVFQCALEHAGCRPGQALMVGDRLDNDIAPAKAAGMRTLHFRLFCEKRREPSSPADTPDAVADRVAEILPAIERLASCG